MAKKKMKKAVISIGVILGGKGKPKKGKDSVKEFEKKNGDMPC